MDAILDFSEMRGEICTNFYKLSLRHQSELHRQILTSVYFLLILYECSLVTRIEWTLEIFFILKLNMAVPWLSTITVSPFRIIKVMVEGIII